MVKTLHSKLPLVIEPYEYMIGEMKIHGFSLLSGNEETEVLWNETDSGIEPGTDEAIDNYIQTKADITLAQISINNHYQMVNLLRKIVEWDVTPDEIGNYNYLPLDLSIAIQSLLNQIDVSNPNLPREEGYLGEDTSTGDLSILPGI